MLNMQRIQRGDINGIDIGILNQFVMAGINPFHAKFLRKCMSLLRHAAHTGKHFGDRTTQQSRRDPTDDDSAQADDAPTNGDFSFFS